MRTYQWAILALVVVGLVLWTAREHFEATQSIKAPPYDDAEKLRIYDMLRSAEQADLLRQAEQTNPELKKARDDAQKSPINQAALETANRALKIKAAEFVTPTVQAFFTQKFKPATVPITNEDVRAYVTGLPVETLNKPILESILKTYFVGQSGVGTSTAGGAKGYAAALAALGQTAGYLIPNTPGGAASSAAGSSAGAGADVVDPICSTPGTTLVRGGCMATAATTPSCPTGYTLGTQSGGIRCEKGTEAAPPECPSGKSLGYDAAGNLGCVVSPRAFPTCPTGYMGPTDGKCTRGTTPGSGMGSPDTSTPASAMTSSGSAMAGNTTGGSSTSVFGPTAGGRGGGSTGGAGKYVVWGPIRGERAEGDQVAPMDSTKSNKYPELLGGLGSGGDKTRIDGVGLAEPSSSWSLSMSGLLPDMSSLGATEASKFLPFSRSPGDMEKIPDPYRVSQTFRTSSYTSKTEPVPFLADFSAFQK